MHVFSPTGYISERDWDYRHWIREASGAAKTVLRKNETTECMC